MNTIICKQLEKYKDKSGKIIGYRLVDTQGNQTQIKSEDLKNQIRTGALKVVNLTLTKDDRLVDGAEQQVKDEELKRAQSIIATIESINVESLQKDDLKLLKRVLDAKLKEVNKRAYKFSAFGIDLTFEVPDFAVVSKNQKLVTEYLNKNEYIPNSDRYLCRSVVLRPDQRVTNIVGMLNDGKDKEQNYWGRPQELIVCWLMKNSLYGLNPEQTEEEVLNKISDRQWVQDLRRKYIGLNNLIFDTKTYTK